jgi:hypothetical protein
VQSDDQVLEAIVAAFNGAIFAAGLPRKVIVKDCPRSIARL